MGTQVIDLTWAPNMFLPEAFELENIGVLRVGFECCQNLMHRGPRGILKQNLLMARTKGIRIHFVLPSPQENEIDSLIGLVQMLSANELVDAWVINEIGLVELLAVYDPKSHPIILGRLWDKSLHEMRWEHIPHFVGRRTVQLGSMARSLVRSGVVCGVEIDYAPGTAIDISAIAAQTTCYVHISSMLVGFTEYCPFAIQDQSPSACISRKVCTAQCAHHTQKISCMGYRPQYQIGNALFALHDAAERVAPLGACIPILQRFEWKGMQP